MRRSRAGVSTKIAAVALVAAFVVSGVGGYLLQGSLTGTASTVTSSLAATSSSVTSSSTSSVTSSAAVTSSTLSSSSTGANQSTVMASLAAPAEAECAGKATCLTIFTTQDAGNWAEFYGPSFDQQYPWAAGKVDYESFPAAFETSELLSQYQAHDVIADLATGTLAPLIPVYQGGAFLNYTSPEVQFMNYTGAAVGPAWVQTDLAIVFMIYNPVVLKADNLPVPTSWSDLANPIYNGKLAFQSAAALSITTAEFYYLYTTMGNSSGQWTNLMKGIAANHPLLPGSAGDAESEVLNGYAAIGIDTLDSVVTALQGDPNAPLKIVDIEPFVYTPGVVAITNGAPDPAMAKLVQAWLISPQGQMATYETNHIPYQTAMGASLLSYLPSDERLVDAYSTYSSTQLYQNTGAWSDTFENIFGA